MDTRRKITWRNACLNPSTYWLIGWLLTWLLVPADLVDILIAPGWFAPHWACDSLGIPIMGTALIAIPALIFCAIFSAVITFLATWKRDGGTDIFDVRMGRPIWNWTVTIFATILIIPIILDISGFLFSAIVPQSFSVDCGGMAEKISVTMRGPFLQTTPLVEAFIVLWLLHLRAFATSPRRL